MSLFRQRILITDGKWEGRGSRTIGITASLEEVRQRHWKVGLLRRSTGRQPAGSEAMLTHQDKAATTKRGIEIQARFKIVHLEEAS